MRGEIEILHQYMWKLTVVEAVDKEVAGWCRENCDMAGIYCPGLFRPDGKGGWRWAGEAVFNPAGLKQFVEKGIEGRRAKIPCGLGENEEVLGRLGVRKRK